MGLAAKLQAAEQQPQQHPGTYSSLNTALSADLSRVTPALPASRSYAQSLQYGATPPQQYGIPQQPYGASQPSYGAQQQQYGAPQPFLGAQPQPQMLPGVEVTAIRDKLASIVTQNSLQVFYPQPRIQTVAAEVAQKDLAGLARRWRLPPNLVLDLVALALYDIVIMADDSGSMKFAENGERIEDLKAMLGRIADAATLFDADGISVRFMNADLAGNNLRTIDEIKAFVAQAKFGGLTPLGTMLDRKILRPFVLGPAKSLTLRKPVLVIVITDGEPAGESSDAVRSAIKDAKKALSASQYGAGAVAFEFAQVGRDADATKFLGKLDTDPKIGGLVDATSYIELEQEEYKRKGIDLTVDLYMVKLLVGAVDSTYDEQDEEKKKKKKSLLGSLFK